MASVPDLRNRLSMVHDSTGMKASISRSRSTTMRSDTDCTRPAEVPRWTRRQSRGLIWYPTNRSRMRRACWALTSCMSISRGFRKASSTASLVIS